MFGFEMAYSTMWLILVFVFIIAEVVTSGTLISIWFGVGSLVAMFAANSGASFIVQMVVFLIVSTILLILTKPLVKKIHSNKVLSTNLDSVIGKTGVVIEDINNLQSQGAVKVSGKVWTARTADDSQTIKKDQLVKISEINGVKLIVEPTKEG